MVRVIVEHGHQVELPHATRVASERFEPTGEDAIACYDAAGNNVGAFRASAIVGYTISEMSQPQCNRSL